MTKISIIKGDITTQDIDAVVNAANRFLRGGGGVDGAIHKAAGPELYKECLMLNGCDTGNTKLTKGYSLSAKYILHTVGPEYGYEQGKESELLESCYLSVLEIAKNNGIRSIAVPAISIGAYKYPLREATQIALRTVNSFIKKYPDAFKEIRFVLFSDEIYTVYQEIYSLVF